VKRFSRAHEDVVAAMLGIQTKLRRHLLEVIDDVVRLFFGRAAGAFGCPLDVDTVLISAGKKKRLDRLLALMARDCVRHDHRIKVTEMWQAVGVVNRSRDVESVHGVTSNLCWERRHPVCKRAAGAQVLNAKHFRASRSLQTGCLRSQLN